jgi:hypothetical protein
MLHNSMKKPQLFQVNVDGHAQILQQRGGKEEQSSAFNCSQTAMVSDALPNSITCILDQHISA